MFFLPHVLRKKAKLIGTHFNNYSELYNKTYYRLQSIHKMSESVPHVENTKFDIEVKTYKMEDTTCLKDT